MNSSDNTHSNKFRSPSMSGNPLTFLLLCTSSMLVGGPLRPPQDVAQKRLPHIFCVQYENMRPLVDGRRTGGASKVLGRVCV